MECTPAIDPIETDADIDSLLSCGDLRGALRLMVDQHGPSIYRYCRAALRDSALAEDVHQQVFIEAHRDLAKFSGRSGVRGWLFAIARHRVLDAAKYRARRTAWNTELDAARDVCDPRPSPMDALDKLRLQEMLSISLDRLNETSRSALTLRYHQGFTFEQMSQICGESAAALHARVARALRQLRTEIESLIDEPLASKSPCRRAASPRPTTRRLSSILC